MSAVTMRHYRAAGLTPYQAKLISEVVESPVPVRHLLIAPPGMGKTHAAMSLAKEITEANSGSRILVITPKSLAAMYEHHLVRVIPGSTVGVVSRRVFRELDELATPGEPIWPIPFVAVIGADTARQADVLARLCSVTWDLVIVEEIQLFARSRWMLLKTILTQDVFSRVLLISATPDLQRIAGLLKNVQRTQWLTPELRDWDDQPIFPSQFRRFRVVRYRRSDEEVSLLRNVLSLARELSDTPSGQVVKKTLLRQAASSPFALERVVWNLRNALMHSVPEMLAVENMISSERPGVERSSVDIDTDVPYVRSNPWRSKADALPKLALLLDQIQSVNRDTKREALEGLLQSLGQESKSSAHYICLLCSFRATADYLQTAVSERAEKTWVLTGDATSEHISNQLEGFRKHGGVLISTVAMLMGTDLSYVPVLVHYDPPARAAEMHVRLTRNSTATNYILVDESGIWPDEWGLAGLSRT